MGSSEIFQFIFYDEVVGFTIKTLIDQELLKLAIVSALRTYKVNEVNDRLPKNMSNKGPPMNVLAIIGVKNI